MRVAVLEDNPARAILLEQTLRLGGHEAVRFREGGALMQALRNAAIRAVADGLGDSRHPGARRLAVDTPYPRQ
uniref:hypothetical protein n=1 Tax=Cupriavidus ulmosensis TaxID=3065913 RepID=UPI00296B3ED0|nr:hypothetical protein [Cupriavidus sp. CV2]